MPFLEKSYSPSRILFSLANAGGLATAISLVVFNFIVPAGSVGAYIIPLALMAYFFSTLLAVPVCLILLSLPEKWFLKGGQPISVNSIGSVFLIDIIIFSILFALTFNLEANFDNFVDKFDSWNDFYIIILLLAHAGGIGFRFTYLLKKSLKVK